MGAISVSIQVRQHPVSSTVSPPLAFVKPLMMFDILVYLFENYAQPGCFPPSSTLMRKLAAVGFERDDISAALDWLAALDGLRSTSLLPRTCTSSASQRVWTEQEQARLPVECRGYLQFLQDAGVIDELLRELIAERALALPGHGVPLARLKIIALMVIWRRHPAIDSIDGLLLDELLCLEDYQPVIH